MGGDRSSACRIISTLTCLACVGAGGYLIWYYTGQKSPEEIYDGVNDFFTGNGTMGDFSDVLDGLGDFDFGDLYNGDPFLSNNETSAWPNDGQGLELLMLNALDDTWQSVFELAISDWDNGDPDALTLTVERIDVDYVCTQVDDVQKVCADSYGETGWLGINEILSNTRTGVVISSVAKMNEYYLRNAETAERQYTMCHEIGHGFGLPHTDESFDNPSLGNCLDYTHTPSDNMHPDETNFKRLASVYGTVPARRRMTQQQASLRRAAGKSRRRLTQDLQQEYDRAVREFEHPESFLDGTTHWRVLREHPQGGADFVRRLGEEHIIQVHMLYANRN